MKSKIFTADQSKESFKELIHSNDMNGLTLIFNSRVFCELNSIEPIIVDGRAGYLLQENLKDFQKLGFNVCGFGSNDLITGFPSGIKKIIQDGPIILISYKWFQNLRKEHIIMGAKKEVERFDKYYSIRSHWKKIKDLKWNYFVRLPKNIYGISAQKFFEYVLDGDYSKINPESYGHSIH